MTYNVYSSSGGFKKMGLAGSIGNQGYSCDDCGHVAPLYSPHCPICLSKNITRPQTEKSAGPSQTTISDPRDALAKARPGNGFGMMALLLVLLVGGYFFVVPWVQLLVNKANESTARTEYNSTKRVNTQVSRPRARKVSRQPSSAQSSRPRSAATGAGSAPRRAAPMKLWEPEQD